MTSRTNLQNQQYNMNTHKHCNTNLLQSNTEEAIKAQNENIIIVKIWTGRWGGDNWCGTSVKMWTH